MKKLIKNLMIFSAIASITLTNPASLYASSKDNIKSTFSDEYNKINVEIKATYSNDIKPTNEDWYCITLKKQLNANQNPKDYENKNLSHIELNAINGIRGNMNPGWYDVIGIYYYGPYEKFINIPVATTSMIRVYKDEPTNVEFAIGSQAIEKLKNSVGEDKIYVQSNGKSDYGIGGTLNAFNKLEKRTVYDEIRVFGDDYEAQDRYIEHLEDNDYLDEHHQFTDKGYTLFEDNSEGIDVAKANIITDDGKLEKAHTQLDNSPIESTEPATEVVFDDGNNNMEEGKDNVIEKRFENEKTVTESKKNKHPFLTMFIKYFPFIIGIVIFLFLFKRKSGNSR